MSTLKNAKTQSKSMHSQMNWIKQFAAPRRIYHEMDSMYDAYASQWNLEQAYSTWYRSQQQLNPYDPSFTSEKSKRAKVDDPPSTLIL